MAGKRTMKWSAVLAGIAVLFNLSCSKDIEIKSAEDFAPYECRAIYLREERFRVAAELHKLAENPFDYEVGKDSLLNIADDLKIRSSLLGDTIKRYIDSLFKYHLKSKASRVRFTDLVRKLNETSGCGK